MEFKLNRTERLILALLRVYGSQPLGKILRIVYVDQPAYLAKQLQYIARTLERLREHGLIEQTETNDWRALEK